ncbi:MAG: hypothetical protein E6J13_03845 [Chloroflexi bacterium]|nr:MAG: hypothetical protein E6J13_03845 [Chloroflexota bacterium]
MLRRLPLLAAAGLLATACFGKFALGVTQTIEPTPILPGASVKQELAVEADGLLGTAVKQGMTDAVTKGQAQAPSGTQWQVRDNSDGSAVHLRMFRTVSLTEAQTAVPQATTGGFDIGALNVRADDWVLVRRYTVRVVVSPSAPTGPAGTPTGNDAAARQLAQAMLAGITYDYYIALPGLVTATNGATGDQSRLVWHLDLTSGTERVLTAESLYPDVPRIVLLLVLVAALVIVVIWLRSRSSRPAPAAPEPPIFSA